MYIENDIFLNTEEMIVEKSLIYFTSLYSHQVATNCTEISHQMGNRNHISVVVEGLKVIFHNIKL